MENLIQRLKSKTYWTAIVGALLMVLEQNSGFFAQYLPIEIRTWSVMLWPVLMVTLRELTTCALSEK